MCRFVLFLLGILGIFFSAFSNEQALGRESFSLDLSKPLSPKAVEAVRSLVILHQGRVKPFDSYAREQVKLITGLLHVSGQDPVLTVLSLAVNPSEAVETKLLWIPYGSLREALGFDKKAEHVSYNDLVSTRKLMRMLPDIVEKQQRDEPLTLLEHEAMDVYDRFVAFTSLIQQQFPMVPPMHPNDSNWAPILETSLKPSWESLIDAVREGDSSQVVALASQIEQGAHRVNPSAYPEPWRIQLEIGYHRVQPFHIARGLYALAALGLLLGILGRRPQGWFRVGSLFLVLSCIVHGAGIFTRVVIGGRPPVSNFYETMLWLPFVAVVVALIFQGVYRSGYFGLAASILAAITLTLADIVPLDSSISPVVAVLRSNLWLTVHVLTIVASYGALALAMVLAHLQGILFLSHRQTSSSTATLETFLYRAIQVGVVLLASGVMLGAVWANASWGRYWGWDPKETWALITLLWFLAVLHGRFAGWIRGVGLALSTIAGFFLLLMTYYGVSFYLVGLHSYAGGHAKPLPPLLIGYLIFEVAFMLLVGVAAIRRQRLA